MHATKKKMPGAARHFVFEPPISGQLIQASATPIDANQTSAPGC